MKKRLLLFVAVAIIANSIFAANWFVKGDGNTNTTGGDTWANAVTLTKAASSALAGETIYLAAGTYSQAASVSLNKAYTVIGGFAGTENEATITPSMSNPTVNISKFTQAASSTFRILSIGAPILTGTVTLQGLTFEGLNNNQNGQAIECPSSSTLTTIIKNCVFKNFTATATGVAGALNVNNVTTDVTIKNCWFENITSGNNGGAMSVNAKVGNTISIKGCTFKNTSTPVVSTVYNGGAIYANNAGYTLNIDSCNFESTKASTGGAIYTAASLTANISNSKFYKCTTANPTAGSGHGGAISFQAPSMNITNCTFDLCSDNGRGLIYWNAASTKAKIKKSIFTNNTSGGTTQNSGAVFCIQNGTENVTIDSCYAYNNTSSAHATNNSASVLYSATGKSNITIKNSAFVGNIGRSTVTRAITYAAAQLTADTINIVNSIVSNNTNLAVNDTLRDVSSFSNTYSKFGFSNSIMNGEFLSTGLNFPLPGSLTPLKKIYTNLLNGGDIATLTSASSINDVVSASNALIIKYGSLSNSITASATTLSGLNSSSAVPSAEQSFMVSGSSLTGDLVITPPVNFEISRTSGSGFISTPLTLTQSDGTVATTTIYVRLKSGLSNNTYTGNISLSSDLAMSKFISLSGTVSGAGIIVSPASLTGYKYTVGVGPSSEQSFSVSGISLTDALIITAPTNYEISAVSGASFSPTSSISIAQSGGVVSPTIIYVRLKAGLPVNSYNENVTLSSTGAVTQYMACVGKVSNPPAVSVSLSSLTGFTYFAGGGPSVPQTFKVSGNDLTAGVTVAPPTGFEISTNLGASYTSSAVTLALTNSNLVDSTIYVRLKSGLAVNSYSGNISVSSTGVTAKTISLSGNVLNAPLISTSTITLSGFNYYQAYGPSAIQSFTISGSYLVDTLVISAPTNYEISQIGGASFVGKPVLKYPQTAGNVSTSTIYIRLKSGLTANTYTGNVVVSTTSGITKSISLTGVIANLPVISTSASNVSGLNYIVTNGPSQEQSFIVNGNYLNSVLLINAPTRCEISTSTGASFSASNQILLTQSGGVAGPTTIYVRLKAGLAANSYTDSLTITSTDAVTKKIYFSGVVSVPTLSVSSTALALTKYIVNNGPSVVQSFDVSGLNLPSNITILAPDNFEISQLPASAFTSSIQLSPVDNSVSNTTLYVRLKSGLSVADYSGIISISSTGAISKMIDLTSKVVYPPTMSQAMGGFDYNIGSGPSAENIILVNAANLDSNIVVTPPSNFEVSLKSLADGGVYSNLPVKIVPSNGVVDFVKVYVRLSAGLPQGAYSDNLTIQSSGVSSIDIPLRGEVKLGTGPSFVNANNSIRVMTTPNSIKVSGTNSGDKIEVYSIKGDKVNTVKANDGETNIKTTGRNVYVVKVITKE